MTYISVLILHVHLMDFVQAESKKWRTGLDYTRLKMDALKSYKRPLLWSDTRMINFEYDQLIRYIESSIWWENPNWVDLLSRLHVPAAYVMKIMMSKVQSTKVKTEYVIRVFQQENSDGKLAMKTTVRLGAALLLKNQEARNPQFAEIIRNTRAEPESSQSANHQEDQSESERSNEDDQEIQENHPTADSDSTIKEILESFPDVLSTKVSSDENIIAKEVVEEISRCVQTWASK